MKTYHTADIQGTCIYATPSAMFVRIYIGSVTIYRSGKSRRRTRKRPLYEIKQKRYRLY